jgi:hypothetical protein
MKSDRRPGSWRCRSLLDHIRGLVAIVPILAPAGLGAPLAAEITGNHRLTESFIQDGAIVRAGWTEFAVSYARQGGGRDLIGSIRAAFRFGEEIEAGLVIGLLDRRREAGDRLFGAPIPQSIEGAGLSDALIYGKYRLLRSPLEMSLGAAATIPFGDEESGRGPGRSQYQVFVGLRKNFAKWTWVSSAGLGDRADSEAFGRAEGRGTVRVATGVLIPISHIWVFMAEANFEEERYRDQGDDGRVLAGLDWRPTENTVFRGAVGAGLTDEAPDVLATLSAAFIF